MNAVRASLSACLGLLLGCSSPVYEFQLTDPPKALNEDLAMAKARESMVRAGFDPGKWKVVKGTGFEQFGQTHWGRFHFTDGSRDRCVEVRLEGDRLLCKIVQLP